MSERDGINRKPDMELTGRAAEALSLANFYERTEQHQPDYDGVREEPTSGPQYSDAVGYVPPTPDDYEYGQGMKVSDEDLGVPDVVVDAMSDGMVFGAFMDSESGWTSLNDLPDE